jgi:CubicO group peptidase (beta-lactamase class C family)
VITVAQLLEQTSGLPASAGFNVIEHPELSLRARVPGAADVHLVSGSGEVFHYCNLNYAILGWVPQPAPLHAT